VIRRALVFLLGLGPVVAPFAACSGDGDGGASDADAAQGSDAPRSDGIAVVDSDSGATDAKPDRGPTYNTDGWIGIPFDPDVDCGFYAAPTPEKMPPRIQWDPCDPGMNVAGWACRQMATNWTPPDDPNDTMVRGLAGRVDGSGNTWLAFRRFSGPFIFELVAEVDGRVHTAIVGPRTSCYIGSASLAGEKVVFQATRENGPTAYRVGALGGDVDKVPLVLERYGDGIGRSYFAGPNAYFVYPANTLKTWTSPGTLVTTVPTPDPGQIGDPTFIGDTMFFALESSVYHRIKVFSVADGIRDFVSYGNDPEKGASAIGTDGKDMVWTEASGHPSPSGPWTTIDIMTAPFTTDPAALVKRRLRSETWQFSGNPFVVGCGYAVREAALSFSEPGVRIVRLSDGRSWRFGKIGSDGGAPWYITSPLAITCDEVFVRFSHGYQSNVARIRLDSLGPGDPPD
jgi:hypothetical protein